MQQNLSKENVTCCITSPQVAQTSGATPEAATTSQPGLQPETPNAPAESITDSAVEASIFRNSNKTQKQNKRKRQTKSIPVHQMSHIIGTNSETWTRFHVLNFIEEENGSTKPNGMTMGTDLRSRLKDDFTCIRRSDGSVLVDAKMKDKSEKLQKIKEICNNSVTTSRDTRMNSTRATVLVPEAEFNYPDEIESCLLC